MPFIGNKPSAVPLTSADITDGIITSAKIADGTIVNADINASAAIVASKLSGVGITEADQWRITANHSGVADVTANWERVDNSGFNYIGTGMTQSSGIFTFPSTGIYFIQFNAMVRVTGGDTGYLASTINITLDNSSYSLVSRAYSNVTSGKYTNAHCSFIFDVTSTANNKVKFALSQNESNTPLFLGYTDENQTYSTFIRLGDT